MGAAAGRTAVLEALGRPDANRLVAAATWSEPVHERGEIIVEARMPTGTVRGLRFALQLRDDGTIARVGQQMLLAPPPAPEPLAIPPDMRAMIDGALANGTPFVVGYVDSSGVPHLSPRGSVQVLNDQQLGLWARDPEGGLPREIARNPNIALYYRDPKTRASMTIAGRARRVEGPTADTIYANQPAIERNFDGRKRGVALIVDIDLLEAAGPGGRTRMTRSTTP